MPLVWHQSVGRRRGRQAGRQAGRHAGRQGCPNHPPSLGSVSCGAAPPQSSSAGRAGGLTCSENLTGKQVQTKAAPGSMCTSLPHHTCAPALTLQAAAACLEEVRQLGKVAVCNQLLPPAVVLGNHQACRQRPGAAGQQGKRRQRSRQGQAGPLQADPWLSSAAIPQCLPQLPLSSAAIPDT